MIDGQVAAFSLSTLLFLAATLMKAMALAGAHAGVDMGGRLIVSPAFAATPKKMMMGMPYRARRARARCRRRARSPFFTRPPSRAITYRAAGAMGTAPYGRDLFCHISHAGARLRDDTLICRRAALFGAPPRRLTHDATSRPKGPRRRRASMPPGGPL